MERQSSGFSSFSRRDILKLMAQFAGGALLYQTMASPAYAGTSPYKGPLKLEGTPKKKTSVLILGAGVAGMTAAYELRKAGYNVKILEFREKAGGRCWTLRGGDTYTELGGATQKCEFEKDSYLNPGPWRIPYHHYAVLDYCRQLKVPLEVFVGMNYNAYMHSPHAFDGKPQRMRHILLDFQGYISEIAAKSLRKERPQGFSKEEHAALLSGLKGWGLLNQNYEYTKGAASSAARGFEVDPGGGLMPAPVFSTPLKFKDVATADLVSRNENQFYEYQNTIFQPVGGMDMIAQAFARELKDVIRFNVRVTKISQDTNGVSVVYTDLKNNSVSEAKADWCLCTIPLSILSQMEVQVGPAMRAAIEAVPYAASFKAGIQFKRRFWEEDERIYGGITYTNTPINRISYPSGGMNKGGKGVLLAAYNFDQLANKFTGMTPQERIESVLKFGQMIHPQYAKEFDNGITVGWHRVPWTNGCYGLWTEESRKQHYDNLCQIDGRILLAGEHASRIPAWLEGAVLSSLDAVKRLHKHIMS